jgi:MGT family glycosyltransferase
VGAVLGVPSWTHAFGGGVPPALLVEAGEVVAPLWSEHGRTVPPHAGCFVDGYLDICPSSVQTVPLEHVGTRLALRPVAASVGTPSEPLDVAADDGRPLVYLTLGNVPYLDSPLPGLVDALAELPVSLLVAVGRHLDPATLGRQPAHVRVERWVDQPAVLRRCAVVVSHGGSGTFLGALSHGVPQLCLPQAADQFRNAAGGTRAGAALALPPPDATPQAVRDAVTRLLGDGAVRRRAEQVAAEIAAMPSPDEVADALVRTVRTRAAGAP